MLTEFFSMGGYGAYVWSAYSLTFLVLGMNLLFAFKERKRTKRILKHFLTQSNKSL